MKKISLTPLFIAALLLSACGQKGPLVLKKVPLETTQTSSDNINDLVPVEQEAPVDELNAAESE